MKPYIICATDFEPEAFKALQYSCMLAGQLKCGVTLLHVQTISLFIGTAIGVGVNYHEQFEDQIRRIHIYYPGVKVDKACVKGAVIEGINEYIDKNGMPIMVIVGNKYNATYNLVPDSNLVPMLRHITAPVISIPYLSDLVEVKRIAFAFDNNFIGSTSTFKWLRQFCLSQDIELHILIGWVDMISYENTPIMHPEAVAAMQGVKYKLHFFKKDHLGEQLVQFAKKNHFHILSIMPRYYNLIKTAYHHSLTKELFMNSNLPLLALHEDN